jgi:hypothetical protein
MFNRTTTAEFVEGRECSESSRNSRSAGNPGGPLIVEQVFARLEAIAIKRGSDGAGDK